MAAVGWQELLIILVILLLIFGAGRLTGLGTAVGKTVRELRDATRDDEPPKPAEAGGDRSEPAPGDR